jgi:hypothetical protein
MSQLGVDDTFAYLLVPAQAGDALCVRHGEGGWAGDQLPELVKPHFAAGSVSEGAVREHAHRHLGEQAGGLDVAAFSAAVAHGSVETFPLVHPSVENEYAGVYLYMDECGLLKGLPRNERACSLAQACGFDGATFHGDVFCGRVRTRPEPARNAPFELADMSSDALWLKRAPADNAAFSLEMERINEALEKNRVQQQARAEQAGGGGGEEDGDGAGDGAGDAPCLDDRERAFWWSQAGDELEVRVPLPEGVRAKELQISLAPKCLRAEVKVHTYIL